MRFKEYITQNSHEFIRYSSPSIQMKRLNIFKIVSLIRSDNIIIVLQSLHRNIVLNIQLHLQSTYDVLF